MKKAVTCAQCGTKMRAGIKFCTKCGYRLRDPEVEALAEAAQAQEVAANLLTEEEVAAIRAAELAAEAEESVAVETSSVEGDVLPVDDDAANEKKRAVLEAKENALAKQNAKAEVEAAKLDAKTEVEIAKVESDIASGQQETDAIARTDAARLELMETGAKVKSAKVASRVAEKLAKRKIAAKAKSDKRNAELDARDVSRMVRDEQRAVDSRASETEVADYKQAREHALAKKKEKEAFRAERIAAAGKDDDFRAEARAARTVAKGLRAEEKKAAKCRRAETEVQVYEKRAENRLYQQRVASDNRIRKRRDTDMQRVAARQAAIRERETKRLGAVQYKAAAVCLTAEAAEAYRLANQAECDMQKQMHESKIAAGEAKAEKKLIRLRASDLHKHSRTKLARREKETRALGRAELRALKIVKTEEALEARRRADEVRLETDEKQREAKRYLKKLAADRKLVKTRAADADKIQKEEIAALEKFQTAKKLEAGRETRMRTDDSERAVRAQKKQTKLYSEKLSAADKLADREHKLAMRSVKLSAARDDKVMTMKEREQKRNAKLAQRYEKDAIKRARRISKISGAPVSLVPALSGEAPSYALLTSVDAADTTPIPTLRDPDSLLARSYESNQEQYRAYKKASKKKEKRLRYVEIGVRNDKKYFDTLYEGGEVMIAKRNVSISRAQGIIAIILMIVALVGSLLPAFTVKSDAVLPEFFTEAILDNQDMISLDSLLNDKPLTEESTLAYFKAFLGRLTTVQFFSAEGLSAFAGVGEPLKAAFAGDFAGFGVLLVLLLLAVGMILTPIVILMNLLVGLLRVIFRMGGRSVAITRVMKNLRASYAMLGFYIVPVLLSVVKPMMGFALYAGSFALAVLLNTVLNMCKKYEKGDKSYARCVRLSGLVRLALVVGFVYMMIGGNVFAVTTVGVKQDFAAKLVAIMMALSCVFTVFCARAVTTLGFEVIGYTKAQPSKHIMYILGGLLAAALPFLAGIFGTLTPTVNTVLPLVLVIVFVPVTAVFGLAKLIIEKRNSMLDPIIHALGEGYPLK